ncbi:hypothetical protein ASC90_02765 [Rhizobium sp. Root1220]|nr:hypothetical protein ASC90_02765 [Rhizobium sp. Root1220]
MVGEGWKVNVAVGDTQQFLIGCPKDALEFLDRHWPCDGGPLHSRARLKCQASDMRLTSEDSSRLPFLAALIEAQIPFV